MYLRNLVKILTVLFFVFIFTQYLFYTAKLNTEQYKSEIIKKNSIKEDTFSENIQHYNLWEKCLNKKDKNSCLRNIFYKETFSIGIEDSMLYLHYLENKQNLTGRDCHFIAHGIGNASFEINKNDPATAFAVLSNSKNRASINSCIKGYFHGVVEKYSTGSNKKEKIIDKYSNICNGVNIEDPKCLNLYKSHGLGHGVYVQLISSSDSLDVCDKIFKNKFNQSSCYTGVFMEEISKEKDLHFEYLDKFYESKYCRSFNEKYRPECYYEQVKIVSEKLVSEGILFEENINICKDIENLEDRFSCIKYFSAYALTFKTQVDINKLCNNTSTIYEKSICKAMLTHKLAFYLDPFKKGLDREIILNTCFQDGDIISGYFCKVLMEKTSSQLDVIRLDEVKDLIFKLPPFFDFI